MRRFLRSSAVIVLPVLLGVWGVPAKAESSLAGEKVALSPAHDARFVERSHPVLIRPGGVIDPTRQQENDLVSVFGEFSGDHQGRIRVVDDGRVLQWIPDKPFAADEKVTVIVNRPIWLRDGSSVQPAPWSFTVSANSRSMPPVLETEDEIVESGRNANESLATTGPILPAMTSSGQIQLPPTMPGITASSDNQASDGYCYMTVKKLSLGLNALLILDKQGTIQFFRDCGTDYIHNFMPLPDREEFVYHAISSNGDRNWVILDKNYQPVDSVHIDGNYSPGLDMHEILFPPNGHVMVIVYDTQVVDLRSLGGRSEEQVTGALIQELAGDTLVWEWRSWDHFAIGDASPNVNFSNPGLKDVVHLNSIDFDTDGNLIISSRELNEITKIDYVNKTGNIIWRFGGLAENNDFAFADPVQYFHRQHAARRLANGDIILFDNGPYPRNGNSSIKEFSLANGTATLTWKYEQNPGTYSVIMGNGWRLDNGNTFMGWGEVTQGYVHASEVDMDGNIHFIVQFDNSGYANYRTYNTTFIGQSVEPELTLYESAAATQLYFAQFDSTVNYYRIYSGGDENSMVCIDSTQSTAYAIPQEYAWGNKLFEVASVGQQGQEIGVSDPVSVTFDAIDQPADPALPSSSDLSLAAYPNPFNGRSRLTIQLAKAGKVKVVVYDVLGRAVKTLANRRFRKGSSRLTWNTGNLASGIYFVRAISADGEEVTKRVSLIR